MEVGRRSSTANMPPPPHSPTRIRGNLLLHFAENLEPHHRLSGTQGFSKQPIVIQIRQSHEFRPSQ